MRGRCYSSVCCVGLLRFSSKTEPDRLFFSNPASTEKRVRMMVRSSPDGGRTWPRKRLLHEGPAAYSCLAVLADGRIGCLYERGEKHPYETITLARLHPDLVR